MTEVLAESRECLTADGLRLHVHRWQPAEPPRALVAVHHGLVEHGGRYAELGRRLARSRLAVWAFDSRGHGRSEGSRVWVEAFDSYVGDLLRVLAQAREEFPGVPQFLFGHSMGGLVVLRAAATGKTDAKGLILSAPAVCVDDGLFPWLRSLAPCASRWLPRLRLARMGSRLLSSDPRVLAEFLADPLVYHGRIPTRTGAEILRASQEMRQQADQVALPLLILQGGADAVVTCHAVEQFYESVSSADKTFRLFPGLYHDLPREPGKDAISAEVAAWIERRCGGC